MEIGKCCILIDISLVFVTEIASLVVMNPPKKQSTRSKSRWRRNLSTTATTTTSTTRTSLLFFSSSLSLLLLLLLLLFNYSTLRSLLFFSSPSPIKQPSEAQYPQCGSRGVSEGERFLFYAPHSGFSNQLSEFKNAIAMAAILNRTLVVPPVLDHHAVVLGSCPKFRVSSPTDLRISVWDHIMDLLRSRRYISMADIVDISSILTSSIVRIIDFRVFASAFCGLNMDLACFSWNPLPENLKQCRSLVSGMEGNLKNCVYTVKEDCRTTVWTYKQKDDGNLDSFQLDKELQRKKQISYIRTRRDVSNSLGPGSEAEMATVLSFGSLFSAPYKGSELYIDIHEAPRDPRIESLLQKSKFLPFVPEITSAGKDYAMNKINEPFLCAQLRLLDGQFKNHWEATFSALKQKIQSLQLERKGKANGPINIFVMTDLPLVNWTGTYLAELASDSNSFKLYTLNEGDDFVLQTARNVRAAEHGLRSSFLPTKHEMMRTSENCNLLLPDISLYLEETICSCASLGFVGTAGSTIAESIELMRNYGNCITLMPS